MEPPDPRAYLIFRCRRFKKSPGVTCQLRYLRLNTPLVHSTLTHFSNLTFVFLFFLFSANPLFPLSHEDPILAWNAAPLIHHLTFFSLPSGLHP